MVLRQGDRAPGVKSIYPTLCTSPFTTSTPRVFILCTYRCADVRGSGQGNRRRSCPGMDDALTTAHPSSWDSPARAIHPSRRWEWPGKSKVGLFWHERCSPPSILLREIHLLVQYIHLGDIRRGKRSERAGDIHEGCALAVIVAHARAVPWTFFGCHSHEPLQNRRKHCFQILTAVRSQDAHATQCFP